MKIGFYSRQVARELAKHLDKTNAKYIVISITDPKSEREEFNNCLNCLHLQFHDTNYKLTNDGFVCFTEAHASEILEFFNNYRDLKPFVLVHCEAGISRSAGVAAALSKIANGDDQIYFKTGVPNSLVYSTILKVYYDPACSKAGERVSKTCCGGFNSQPGSPYNLVE